MAEPSTDRTGTKLDRAITVGQTATAAGAVGLLVGVGDWLLSCQDAHAWVPIDRGLMIMLMTAIAPIAHLLLKIVINKLEQLAEQKANA